MHVAGGESHREREAGAGKGTTCGWADPAVEAAQRAAWDWPAWQTHSGKEGRQQDALAHTHTKILSILFTRDFFLFFSFALLPLSVSKIASRTRFIFITIQSATHLHLYLMCICVQMHVEPLWNSLKFLHACCLSPVKWAPNSSYQHQPPSDGCFCGTFRAASCCFVPPTRDQRETAPGDSSSHTPPLRSLPLSFPLARNPVTPHWPRSKRGKSSQQQFLTVSHHLPQAHLFCLFEK